MIARYTWGETELEPVVDYITSLISAYEDEHYPIHDVSPVEIEEAFSRVIEIEDFLPAPEKLNAR